MYSSDIVEFFSNCEIFQEFYKLLKFARLGISGTFKVKLFSNSLFYFALLSIAVETIDELLMISLLF
jgi:hypothetical protein